MDVSNPVISYTLPVVAGITIVMNSMEIHFIRPRRRRCLSPSMIFVNSLSQNDLVMAIMMALLSIIQHINRNYYPDNKMLCQIKGVLTDCSIWLSLCNSALILTVCTYVKMSMATENNRFSKSQVQRRCNVIWFISFVVTITDSVAHRMQLIPKDIEKYRELIYGILTYAAITVFSCNILKIYIKLKRSSIDLIKYNSRRSPSTYITPVETNFTKITGLSLIAFIACWLPLATYLFVNTLCNHWLPNQTQTIIRSSLTVLALFNKIANPIVYFSVYRPSWILRSRVGIEFNDAVSYIARSRGQTPLVNVQHSGEKRSATVKRTEENVVAYEKRKPANKITLLPICSKTFYNLSTARNDFPMTDIQIKRQGRMPENTEVSAIFKSDEATELQREEESREMKILENFEVAVAFEGNETKKIQINRDAEQVEIPENFEVSAGFETDTTTQVNESEKRKKVVEIIVNEVNEGDMEVEEL